jgi:hypothetical protein
MGNEKALGEFMGQIAEIRERLAELQTFVDDHMGYDSDGINWSHVGTAEHFLSELTALTDFAYRRGEYAE